MALKPAADMSQLPENGTYVAQLDGQEILLVKSASGIFAIENMCSHAYQKPAEGKVKKMFIFCPAHGVRFDLRNGCPSGKLTDQPIKVWHAEIVGDKVMVDLSVRLDPGA